MRDNMSVTGQISENQSSLRVATAAMLAASVVAASGDHAWLVVPALYLLTTGLLGTDPALGILRRQMVAKTTGALEPVLVPVRRQRRDQKP